MAYARVWVNLKSIMLSKHQTQKATCCMIPFAGNVLDRQICRNRRQIRGCQGLAGRSWECLLTNRVSLGVMKML